VSVFLLFSYALSWGCACIGLTSTRQRRGGVVAVLLDRDRRLLDREPRAGARLDAFSASTGGAMRGHWSCSLATADAGFILGTVCVALCVLVNLGGLRTYFRFQTISCAVGVVTLAVLMGVFVFSSQSDFSSG
jgi:hypothetical protein